MHERRGIHIGSLLIGKTQKGNKKIILGEKDRFGHICIIGPTRCGKTSKIIKPCIWQDLLDIKRKRMELERLKSREEKRLQRKIEKIRADTNLSTEEKIAKIKKAMDKKNRTIENINMQRYVSGLTCIEPKGDLAEDVVKMCKALDLPYKYINPLSEYTDKLNIMQGDPEVVAESNRTVLRNLFGKQEQFFALIQEITARNTMLLLKKLKGDKIDIIDVARALRDQSTLKKYVDEYEAKYGDDDMVQFYRSEVFGTLKDKFYQFALGLRSQLEDIGRNEHLQRVLIGDSTIDLDKHLSEGGILIVNTCMGVLGNLGDTFGEFIVMHLQNAVFRRPGDEWTRPHHYLWIDEAPRYMNPDLERLMAIGGSYRCATHLAIQTNAQMELDVKPQFAEIILNNCRTKIVFGGLSARNAKLFEGEFGQVEQTTKQYAYNYRKALAIPPFLPKTYRATKEEKNRYTYTDIMELKSRDLYAEALVKYIKNGEVQPPEKVITRVRKYKKPLEFKLIDLLDVWEEKRELARKTKSEKKEDDLQQQDSKENDKGNKVIKIPHPIKMSAPEAKPPDEAIKDKKKNTPPKTKPQVEQPNDSLDDHQKKKEKVLNEQPSSANKKEKEVEVEEPTNLKSKKDAVNDGNWW